jgi:hypothetical protein
MPTPASEYKVNKKASILLVGTGVVLIVMNVLLLQQNKELKAYAGKMNRSLGLKPGTEVPPLKGVDLNGAGREFSFGEDARKTLLLILSPTCGPCKENMPNWEALMKDMDERLARVVVVSTAPRGVKEFTSGFDLGNAPVIAEIDQETRTAYNMIATPQTILIGPDGKTERTWTGPLSAEMQQDVKQALGYPLSKYR